MSLENAVKVQKYESLLNRMKGRTFSWNMAQHLVGGEKRLMRLMEGGRIHGVKPDGAPNSQWQIDATEVILNVKPLPVRVKYS